MLVDYGGGVTGTRERTVIEEALDVLDNQLQHIASREVVSAIEVTNLLLDLRILLTSKAQVATPEPVGV